MIHPPDYTSSLHPMYDLPYEPTLRHCDECDACEEEQGVGPLNYMGGTEYMCDRCVVINAEESGDWDEMSHAAQQRMNLNNTMKAPTKNEMTSFHGHEVKATPNELIAIAAALEAPFSDYNTGEGKTNFDFDFETNGGTYFTVYDWKEYRAVGMDETLSWHIGGRNPMSSSEGRQELSEALAKLRTTLPR